MCSINKDGDNNAEIENCVNEFWKILEDTQVVMDELSSLYLQLNDIKMHKEVMQESDNLQLDLLQTIDSAQKIVVSPALSGQSKSRVQSATSLLAGDILTEPSHKSPTTMQGSNNLDLPSSNNTGSPNNQQREDPVSNTSSSHQVSTQAQQHEGTPAINRHLKPLRVPTFDGNKVQFEEFWSLFQSLVDASNEPVNLKMARLQQSLVGRAHEAIRCLGASAPEYEEAKEILKTKFGVQPRQIRAYMDELEIYYNDVENFADLVRVTVVKLKAENRHAELGEGTLHNRLVKKLLARNLECYSRWLSVNNKDPAVTSLSDCEADLGVIRTITRLR